MDMQNGVCRCQEKQAFLEWCMASVIALTTQKEKIVNGVRKVTMIHPGDQQLLRIPLNAQSVIATVMPKSVVLIMLSLQTLEMSAAVSA